MSLMVRVLEVDVIEMVSPSVIIVCFLEIFFSCEKFASFQSHRNVSVIFNISTGDFTLEWSLILELLLFNLGKLALSRLLRGTGSRSLGYARHHRLDGASL